KIYRACVQRVLVYGSETWPMKVNDMQRLVRTENSMVRWMSGVTLKDRRPSEKLRLGLGIEGVEEVVRRGRLRWFGHVERKEDDDDDDDICCLNNLQSTYIPCLELVD